MLTKPCRVKRTNIPFRVYETNYKLGPNTTPISKRKMKVKSNRRQRNKRDCKTKTQTFQNGGGELRAQPTITDQELKPT